MGETITEAAVPMEQFSPEAMETWYDGKKFSADWTSLHCSIWAALLKPYRNAAARVLEIGSFEGRSSIFFLNYLPNSRLVCVDTFDLTIKTPELAAFGIDGQKFDPQFERQFDFNVAAFSERIEKIKAPSAVALANLGIADRKFEISYIDGSHRSPDVYTDAVLIWPMMVRRGIVIFDDYQWTYMPCTLEHPKLGIDSFLRAFEGQYRVLHFGYQIAVEKL